MLKVGLHVMISPDSVYYGECDLSNPRDVVGIITDTEYYDRDRELVIEVMWSLEYDNIYRYEDLLIVG